MADSTKRAQVLRELLNLTNNAATSTALTGELTIPGSTVLGQGSSFRQRLVNAQETGQPIPDVTLVSGDKFTNVVVTEVDSDSVLFTDPTTEQTAVVKIEAIASFGTLAPL